MFFGAQWLLPLSLSVGVAAMAPVCAWAGVVEKNFDDSANGRIVARANTMVTCDSPRFRRTPAAAANGVTTGTTGDAMRSQAAMAMSNSAASAEAPCVEKEIVLNPAHNPQTIPEESRVAVQVDKKRPWQIDDTRSPPLEAMRRRADENQQCPMNMANRDICLRRLNGIDQQGYQSSIQLKLK